MNIDRAKRWGFILIFLGFGIGIPGVWMIIAPDRYEATVRIQVEHQSDSQNYDPYFIQTEFEIIKSDAVLGKVVENLHLAEEWGKRYADGHKLEMQDAIGLLKQSLRLEPVRNTMLLDINFYSEEPAEAASVANEIAAEYKDLRLKQSEILQNRGIQLLKEEQIEQQKKIDDLEARIKDLENKIK